MFCRIDIDCDSLVRRIGICFFDSTRFSENWFCLEARVRFAGPAAGKPSKIVLPLVAANTDPQRDSIFTKGPADVLDHATSEIAIGTKLGIDATHKLAGEGFKRPWPPLIRMDETVKQKINQLFNR